MAKRSPVAQRPLRLNRRTIAHLDREARAAARRQHALAAVSDRSVARLFVLSAALSAASAILGELQLSSSNAGVLSWIAIVVTALAWIVGAIAERKELVAREATATPEATPDGPRRRDLLESRLAEGGAVFEENEPRLIEKRRWTAAMMQLVALQTALIVAVELAAR